MYPTVFTFDYDLFIAQIPAYSNPTNYPEAILKVWWDIGSNTISPQNYGNLNDAILQYALNLMAAHVTYCNDVIGNSGSKATLTIESGSTIDKVSITLKPPESANPFQFYLNASPYGITLLGLLSSASAGGFYIGGSPETGAFRGVNGGFGNNYGY